MSALPEGLVTRWKARTVAIDGDHLLWTGCGYVKWLGETYKPARIAFTLHNDREADGYAKAECGQRGCVNPAHIEDEPGRQRVREAFRAMRGLPKRATVCANGHDQKRHGKYDGNGVAYCHACIKRQTGDLPVGMVPTEQARWQLQALAVDGFPLYWLAEQLDVSDETLSSIRRGQRQNIPRALHDGITYAYRQYAGTNPARYGIPSRAIGRSQGTAERNGWTAP